MFERQYWNLSFEVRGDRRRQHRVRRRRARRRRPALLLLSGAAETATALEITASAAPEITAAEAGGGLPRHALRAAGQVLENHDELRRADAVLGCA